MMGKQKKQTDEKKSRLASPQNVHGHSQQHSTGRYNGGRASSPCYLCQSAGRTPVWLIQSRKRATKRLSRLTQRSITHCRSLLEIDFNEVVAVVGAVVVVSVYFLKLTCRIKCPASEQVPVTVEWKGRQGDIKQLKSGTSWFTLKNSSVFPGEFPRVLPIQTV